MPRRPERDYYGTIASQPLSNGGGDRSAAIVGNACRESSGIDPLNKPVIVSDEALVAPVLVPDVTSGSIAGTASAAPAYIVLAGISFSHFLNDTMQSLIASINDCMVSLRKYEKLIPASTM